MTLPQLGVWLLCCFAAWVCSVNVNNMIDQSFRGISRVLWPVLKLVFILILSKVSTVPDAEGLNRLLIGLAPFFPVLIGDLLAEVPTTILELMFSNGDPNRTAHLRTMHRAIFSAILSIAIIVFLVSTMHGVIRTWTEYAVFEMGLYGIEL